jgi:hypothetical protein
MQGEPRIQLKYAGLQYRLISINILHHGFPDDRNSREVENTADYEHAISV